MYLFTLIFFSIPWAISSKLSLTLTLRLEPCLRYATPSSATTEERWKRIVKTAAEYVAEMTENVFHIHPASVSAKPASISQSCMTELVILLPLVGVAQDLICLCSFLEFFLSLLIPRVFIGVKTDSLFPVSLLKLFGRSSFIYSVFRKSLVCLMILHHFRIPYNLSFNRYPSQFHPQLYFSTSHPARNVCYGLMKIGIECFAHCLHLSSPDLLL